MHVQYLHTSPPYDSISHHALQKDEIEKLRQSLHRLQAENDALASQLGILRIAQLHSNTTSPYRQHTTQQQNPHRRTSQELSSVLHGRQHQEREHSDELHVFENEMFQSRDNVGLSDDDEDRRVDDTRFVEMERLKSENIELKEALEKLSIENKEMAERIVEVAFTTMDGGGNADGTESDLIHAIKAPTREYLRDHTSGDIMTAMHSSSTLSDSGYDRLYCTSPMGALRRIVFEDASMAEKEGTMVNIDSTYSEKNGDGRVVDGGPSTPEQGVDAGTSMMTPSASERTEECYEESQHKHIPAALYLEE